ncbi:MAG TPA: hypothetical protein PKN57_02495 [Saprospiraceae bacterium]|nr:hypothetical protein [Saprospiraceae bacterium]MCC6688882.1 hypothetical protein [Saprospiraceae bacterium]HMV23734.1 hypothetical protein [Saprospiraceae bacterium]HMW74308.1 hypothetical protein [Saprospiraceae bacterium]HMX83561.1 hypothetical protein [Saprospiraceae bacterium]
MKKLFVLTLIITSFVACKQERKELIAKKWVYDTDEMYKVTSKNLEKLEARDKVLEGYKTAYLDRYRDVSYTLDKTGKLVWQDKGVIRNGQWGLADNDSTLILDADTVQTSFKILKLTSSQMIFQDNVVNTSPQFELSKPILKSVK